MTLDYKILGQLYYGPEISETPAIPGTSGYYTYTTGSIANRFVAIKLNGNTIAYSDNGISWTSSTLPISNAWQSVAYGNNKFVITSFSSNKFVYSADGLSWTETTVPLSGVWRKAIYGNNKFVVVPAGSSALYSSDGINWTVASIPSADYSSLAYGNNTFVAINVTPNYIGAYSLDGISWTGMNMPTLTQGGASWRSVVFGNGKFVAVSLGEDKAAYSTNGIDWTLSNLPSSQTWFDIAFGNGTFVAVSTASNANNAAYSADGINWTPITMPNFVGFKSIEFGNNIFVATSVNDSNSAYSTNGITWTISSLPSGFTATDIGFGQVNTLTEVQISIGGQGTPGSYVEIIQPQVVYTVPGGTETTITSIFVTNQDTVERTFDIAVVPSGETLSLKHHIRWDMPVGATDFDLINAKITMSAGDKVYVFPSTVNKVGFTLFGVEKS